MEEKKLYLEITYNKVIHKVDQTWEWNLEFGQSVDSDTKMGQHDFSKGRKMQEETQFWPKHEFHATLYVLWRTKNYAWRSSKICWDLKDSRNLSQFGCVLLYVFFLSMLGGMACNLEWDPSPSRKFVGVCLVIFRRRSHLQAQNVLCVGVKASEPDWCCWKNVCCNLKEMGSAGEEWNVCEICRRGILQCVAICRSTRKEKCVSVCVRKDKFAVCVCGAVRKRDYVCRNLQFVCVCGAIGKTEICVCVWRRSWRGWGNPVSKLQRLVFVRESSKKITEVAFCFHLESSNQNIDDFIMLVPSSISGPLFAAASLGILQRDGIGKSRE